MSQNPYNNMSGPRGPMMGGGVPPGGGPMGNMGPGGINPMGGGPGNMTGGGMGATMGGSIPGGGPSISSGGPVSISGGPGTMSGQGAMGRMPMGMHGMGGYPSRPMGPGSSPGMGPGPTGTMGHGPSGTMGPGSSGGMIPVSSSGMGPGFGGGDMGPGSTGGMGTVTSASMGPGQGAGAPTGGMGPGTGGGMRMMGMNNMNMSPGGQYPGMSGMMRPGMMGNRMPVSTSGMMGAPTQSAPAASMQSTIPSNITVDSSGNTDGSQGADAGAQNKQLKDINTSTICRIGQETVEEIVARSLETFSLLKSLQPPVGQYNQHTQQNDRGSQERQNRLQELLKGIGLLFKRLRVCWDKCEETTAGVEHPPLYNLIPLKDDSDSSRLEIEKKRGEAYKSALEEHNELTQQIILKNRHLKDIIDQMRNTIWEINTMLAMRTS